MRFPKLPDMRYQPNALLEILTIVCLFGGAVLVVGSLIAMSITSGILAILLLSSKGATALFTLFKALGVEALVLVIAIVMWYVGLRLGWRHG